MDKLFWLKLDKNFFKRHDVRIIEAMPNGTECLLFYIKLLCESLDHGGKLRFSEEVPYTVKMLATITNTNTDIAKEAIEIFIKLGLMEIDSKGTYKMNKVEAMTGSASNSSGANRQRRYRERLKEKENEIENETEETVTQTVTECNNDVDDIPYQEIVDEFNSVCKGLTEVDKLDTKRKRKIRNAYNYKGLGRENISKAFIKVVQSDFLNGENQSNWKATFDWIMNIDNLLKILEGNYDNYDAKKDAMGKIARGRKLKELESQS